MRRLLTCLGAAALLAGVPAVMPSLARKAAAGSVQLVPLTIETGKGRHTFSVELARTEEEQARGLMYRTSLPRDGGMLFPMSPPRQATFWMKNTLIPLDMIFIRADGTIARIAANTVPETLDLVDSGEPVAAVLEIAGGGAARQGISAGDRVRWSGGPKG